MAVVALAGLFWLLKPDTPGAPSVTDGPDARLTVPAAPPPHDVAAPAKPAVIAIEIRQNRRVAGPEVIRATQGDEVRLRLTSDQDAELHLHGYDLHLHLHAGTPRDWAFVARHSGRFELELHGKGRGAHEAISVIEVLPR
jgi:FtsP/CotA-like multicopper oxidase with cupredoxin domain